MTGQPIDIDDAAGQDALDWVARWGDHKACELLLRHFPRGGKHALAIATRGDLLRNLEFLLRYLKYMIPEDNLYDKGPDDPT
ncbi:hypothetical protein HK097_007380 [Rhizophlyctis rosea]|uniref:Uncharacterized protein n=1 Tax=Rhizophlyctis rosea TaxID=64517 RepID=A0AAD5X5X7_9FUNG|nr:hypothetical protein HK097_007380 [Rhizophlyctis rosea]